MNIDGVQVLPLKRISTGKGDILHALKATDSGYCGFGEAYFSEIEPGEVKGWKRHSRYVLNIVVPVGEILFVMFDDREDSVTKGTFQEVVLSAYENYGRLVVPPGVWMAFQGKSDKVSMLMDIIPEVHDNEESDKCDLSEINYTFCS